jgi:hypothetical protein
MKLRRVKLKLIRHCIPGPEYFEPQDPFSDELLWRDELMDVLEAHAPRTPVIGRTIYVYTLLERLLLADMHDALIGSLRRWRL